MSVDAELALKTCKKCGQIKHAYQYPTGSRVCSPCTYENNRERYRAARAAVGETYRQQESTGPLYRCQGCSALMWAKDIPEHLEMHGIRVFTREGE